jgi:2-methylcitrate dehydratase PrpD
VDPEFPGPGRFKGAVRVTLNDGRLLTEIEEYNRGSAQNPMSREEIRHKFDENASGFLDDASRDRFVEAIDSLEQSPDISQLVDLAIAE